MPINENWNIRSRSHVCTHSGEPFTDGETFYTALFEDPKTNELMRRDYSLSSWDLIRRELQPFSFWKSVYEAPHSEAKPEVMEKEGAEDLLRRLIEEDDIGTENTRYILAVMLERKRLLKQTATRDTEDASFLIYENPKTGEVLIVRDPELRLDQVEAVQREVSLMLGYGPKASEGAAPAPQETAPVAEAAEAEETADETVEAAEAAEAEETVEAEELEESVLVVEVEEEKPDVSV